MGRQWLRSLCRYHWWRGTRLALLGLVAVASPRLLSIAASGPLVVLHAAALHQVIAVAPYTPQLTGKVVRVELSGLEPDFDPVRRVIISATLHDNRSIGAVPNSMLVLSTYLEVFQPDTTPVLPDLLAPNQTAQSLGGILQGKAALVNAAGQTIYNGGMLGEVFLNNTVHLSLTLVPTHGGVRAPDLQIKGGFTLYRDLTVRGQLRAPCGGTLDGLAVAAGPAVSWQQVIAGLTVQRPPMVGTGGGGQRPAPPPSALLPALTPATASSPSPRLYYFGADALLALIGLLLLWAPWARKRTASEAAPTASGQQRPPSVV